jgi:uncharacterized protein (DUF2249 family)
MMDKPLDVRSLEPPEPMQRILEALFDLRADGRLRVLHRREPFPLYDILHRMGYRWETTSVDGCFEILIWREQGSAPSRSNPC